jgi:HK97 gp10 family phage protein
MNTSLDFEGLPELAARLDKVAIIVADPLARRALSAGGEVVRAQAQTNVRKLTGDLAGDVITVTRVLDAEGEKYVLIGPAYDLDHLKVRHRGRYAGKLDTSSSPGVYGLFLETGHGPAGSASSRRADVQRAGRLNLRAREFGTGSGDTPPYPWLRPAYDAKKDEAMEVVANTIREGLEGLKL